MGKYDLGRAKKIIEGMYNLSDKELPKVAQELSEARAKRLSPAAEKANNKAYEIVKAKENMSLMNEARANAELAKSKNIVQEEVPRSLFEAPTKRQYDNVQKIRKSDKFANEAEAQEIEIASRRAKVANEMPEEATMAMDDKTKVAAIAAVPASNQFNPVDRLQQIRRGIVDKILDLTGDPVNENPHVPQYAKDTYNKAADALLTNVSDPLNYAGGGGVANAAMGAASTAYDMYKNGPVTSYPNANPAQKVNIKP